MSDPIAKAPRDLAWDGALTARMNVRYYQTKLRVLCRWGFVARLFAGQRMRTIRDLMIRWAFLQAEFERLYHSNELTTEAIEGPRGAADPDSFVTVADAHDLLGAAVSLLSRLAA